MKKHIVFDMEGTLVQQWGTSKSYFEDIPELIEKLKQKGCELYIWTNMSRHGLDHFFSVNPHQKEFFTQTSSSTEFSFKPDVSGLESLLVGCDKSECVMIGDSSADEVGSASYGIDFIPAFWNPACGSQLRTAQKFINDYKGDLNCLKLLEVLENL